MIIKDGRELTIRRAEVDDAADILTYLNRIGTQSHNLSYGEEGSGFTLEQEQAFIQGQKEREADIMLLGIVDERIVSIASSSPYAKKRMAHRSAVEISVERACWNLGIARAMMQELISYAKKNTVTEVLELEVVDDNKHAIHLYRQLGFQVMGYYEKFFKVEDEYYGAYYMYLLLQKDQLQMD